MISSVGGVSDEIFVIISHLLNVSNIKLELGRYMPILGI
jgi:hypothetical protein